MKKNKNLKGFTLIELIVVMAIFGVLLVGVMKLIDPVSKLMAKTSVQESNSASVNNIKSYFEQSLRYSDFIATYKNGFSVADGVNRKVATEDEAVKDFVDTYYKNRIVDGSNTIFSGKVRVMKINNTSGGTIDEDIYNFTSAQTYLDALNAERTISASTISLDSTSTNVINPDYYRNYSFYITTGYNEVKPMTQADAANAPYSLPSVSGRNFYYGILSEMKNETGSVLYPFGPSMFSLSIMTYKSHDADDASAAHGNFKGNVPITDDPSTPFNEAENVAVFKSPYYLANSTVSLVNTSSSDLKAYGIDYDQTGTPKSNGGTANVYRDVTPAENRVPVYELTLGTSSADDGNVYFIYSLPSDNR